MEIAVVTFRVDRDLLGELLGDLYMCFDVGLLRVASGGDVGLRGLHTPPPVSSQAELGRPAELAPTSAASSSQGPEASPPPGRAQTSLRSSS